jgi:energy-coupling factor transporter ATP-binding protein EcfA2/2-polyprenyl-3-methyl-5-hydroxy-6-metoxy-1,4-benzoquinol methylase
MSTEVNTARADYWNRKHKDPSWDDDIHFAFFKSNQGDLLTFKEGIALNTSKVCQEILERGSIFGLSKTPRILDFACGSGDLLISLAELLPAVEGTGIDIAEMAIQKAQARQSSLYHDKAAGLTFRVGGISELQKLAQERQSSVDVIICRDAYYLFSKEEQRLFWLSSSALLAPGGIVYIADLAAQEDTIPALQSVLIERQHGGAPISWHFVGHSNNHRAFSIEAEVPGYGFTELGDHDVDERAVYMSYRVAGQLAVDGQLKKAYKGLEDLANGLISKTHSSIPYARFIFRKSNTASPLDSRISLRVQKDFRYGSEPILLRKGKIAFPENRWSLVVGRSGVGKTSLIRVLSRQKEARGMNFHQSYPPSIFVLSQHPTLVQKLSIEMNMRLYCDDSALVNQVMDRLGFDAEKSMRLADKNLSGGEKQRVALGQAIVAQPELLLLDEPCVGIDRVRKYHFFAALRKDFLERGRQQTVICVDHEFHMIMEFFDFVFELIDGDLVMVKG